MLSQTGHFPTVTPAEAGVDANGILRFLDACQERKINLHGLLLLREGEAVAEDQGLRGEGREEVPELPPITDPDDMELEEGDVVRNIQVNIRLYEGWDE